MYKLTPTTFDGTDIDDGSTYASKFLHADDPARLVTREPVEVDIPGDYAFPTSPRSQPQPRILPLRVRILSTTQAALDSFKRLFDPMKGDVLLKAQDGADPAVTYRLTVRVIDAPMVQGSLDSFAVRLYVARPIFESDTENSDPETADETPHAWNPVPEPAGTVRCYPTFRIKPVVAKANTADYLNRWQYSVAWRSEMRGVDSQGLGYPFDVADGNLDTEAEVDAEPARMQADGDDLRVLVDGREMRRDLSGIDGANTKVWSSPSLKPRIMLTLRDAMTAGSPANGESFRISDPGGIPPGTPRTGWFMVEDEAIWYGDHDGVDTFSDILRGSRRTTAATHDVGTAIYRIQHDVQVVSNYTAATDPNADDDRKPVIDLANSSNLKHVRAGPFTPVPGTLRTGALLPKFTRDNLLSAAISMLDDGDTVAFRDVAPSATAPQFNNLELYVPCGVKAAAGAITHDVSVEDLLNLEVYGHDIEGFRTLLERYHSLNDGSVITITPAVPLSRLIYCCNSTAVTGCNTGDLNDVEVDTASRYQQFTLDQALDLWAMLVRLKKEGTPDGDVVLWVCADASDEPGIMISPTFTIPSADIGASYADIVKRWEEEGPALYCALPADKYWLGLRRLLGTGDGRILWSFSETRLYAKGLFGGGGGGVQGPRSGGTFADDTSFGTLSWTNPNNAGSSDDAYATATHAGPDTWYDTYYLKATNFGFSIPTAAVIKGIQVEWERSSSHAALIKDASIRLAKAAAVVGEDKMVSTWWPTADGYKAYGGPSDLWGVTWTAAEINAVGFGAVLSAMIANGTTASIDHVQITVWYEVTPGAPHRSTHFAVLGTPQANIQPEAPAGSAHEAALDNIEITFDNTTPRTPKIIRGSQETIYFLRGVLRNDDTGQEITLACPMALNDILEIDCFHKTVTLYPYSDSEPTRDVPWAAAFSDEVEWMRWDPGAVDMIYTEAGIGEVEVEAAWRDAWA